MSAAETISITMTSEQFSAVRESVEAGEYASTSKVLRDAMHLSQRQRREYAERLDVIRACIQRSLDDPRAALSLDEVDVELEKMFAEAEKDTTRA